MNSVYWFVVHLATLLSAAESETPGDAAPAWYDGIVGGLHRALDPIADAIKPWFFAPLDRFLDSLPMWVAQACAIGLFVVAGLAVCFLRRRYVYLGAPDQLLWRDLRIWSLLLLVPYIFVYVVWGR